MKMKLNLGEGGIKGFLARHVEKIVFGLAVLVVLWVALPDSQRKPIEENLRPTAIISTATSATNRLARTDVWDGVIKPERFKQPDNYRLRAEGSLTPIDHKNYPAEIPLHKPAFPMDLRRTDPKIYTIEKIEVAVSYGPVTTAEDPRADGRAAIRRPTEKPVEVDGRPLPPSVMERLQKYGAPAGMGSGDGFARGGGRAAATGGTKVEGKYIVSILGQVPVKRQIGEYKAVLEDAADYIESRDVPNYGAGRETEYGKYYYQVERAEVAPDGTEGAWKVIGNSTRARKTETGWPAVSELADARFVDPVWTMALPPLMMRDLRPLALHSEVPSQAQAAEAAAEPEAEPEKDPMDDLDGPLAGPRAGPADPLAGLAGDPRPAPVAPFGRMPRGGGEGMGFGGHDMLGGENVAFKLFRYFDMDVQPGKTYVYRVKLYMEDPNDPAPPATKPQPRVLDKSVIERLARKTDKSVWWRESDYSQVSAVVRVPATKQVLAGSVLPPGTLVKEDPEKPIGTRIQETMANVMALVWDEKEAKDVPGTKLAGRGDVLNFKSDVEAIDVSASMLVKLPAYAFETNNVVLDVRGGEPLGRKSDLTAPGEILLIDGSGNLIVRQELADQPAFAENTFPAAPKSVDADLPLDGEPEKRPGTRPRPPRPGSGEGGGLLDGPPRPRRER